MFDSDNKIIYIGKAKDLYKRVSQYFLRPQSGKVAAMVMHVDHFNYIITANEKEALILEMNLIHEHMPRYNILLKDDSHYPYIALAKTNNPILKIARNNNDKKYYYFGPYPNSGDAYKIIDLLNKLFPLRKCKNLPKVPCLYKDLGQCLAPCVNKIDEDVYLNMVNKIRAFLDGNDLEIKNEIKNKMLEASEKQQYEQANEFKKLLDAYSIENERLGTWNAIGYDAVESSEFSFNQITKLDEFFGAFVVIEGVKATNLVELAECPALSSWIMRCGLNSEKDVVCECSIESENKDACAEIAPSFMRLCE